MSTRFTAFFSAAVSDNSYAIFNAHLRCDVLAAEVFVGWQPSDCVGVDLGAVGLGVRNYRVQPVVAIYWRWD